MSDGSTFSEELKRAIREFIAQNGAPVQFEDDPWWGDDDTHHHVSTYGWGDWRAQDHCRPVSQYNKYGGCHWEVPEGSFLYEESYSMFTDTFHDNHDEEGINVSGCRCACGKYTDVTLRWTGTLADLINHIAPKEPTEKGWKL